MYFFMAALKVPRLLIALLSIKPLNSASVIGSLLQPVTKKLFFSKSFWKLPGTLEKQADIKCVIVVTVVAFHFIPFR